MPSRPLAKVILPRLLLVAAVAGGAAAAYRASGGEPAKTAPSTAPAGARQVKVTDYGPVGDVVRRFAEEEPDAFGWFKALPAAGQERVVADLNTWAVRVEIRVEPKGLAPDGLPAAWRFAPGDEPVVVVEPSGDRAAVGKLTGRALGVDVNNRPAGEDDRRAATVLLSWELPKGQGVPVAPGVKGTHINIAFDARFSARPTVRPATGPATRPDKKD